MDEFPMITNAIEMILKESGKPSFLVSSNDLLDVYAREDLQRVDKFLRILTPKQLDILVLGCPAEAEDLVTIFYQNQPEIIIANCLLDLAFEIAQCHETKE